MRLVDRYLARTILTTTLLVLAVIIALHLFSLVLREVDDMGRGQYGIADAILFALRQLPGLLYQSAPLVALLGAILGLGSLAASSELVALRAAGLSQAQLSLAVARIGAVIVVVALLIGEGFAPHWEREAQRDRLRALTGGGGDGSAQLWARDGDVFISIGYLLVNGIASEMTLYRRDSDGRPWEIIQATQGRFRAGEWYLAEVRRTRLEPAIGVVVEQLDHLRWPSALTPEVVGAMVLQPGHLSLPELFIHLRYMVENDLEAGIYQLSFWSRIFQPLATIGMVLLAVPFVFTSARAISPGKAILIGVIIGITFYLFNAIFGQIGLVYRLPPLVAALLPTLLVYLLWWFMVRRAR
jgi:lipopolysaccharide export system permease protein